MHGVLIALYLSAVRMPWLHYKPRHNLLYGILQFITDPLPNVSLASGPNNRLCCSVPGLVLDLVQTATGNK